ncbi:MAG: hypothetical protein FWE29_03480 [Defluviitaleaceae bacterium]|nr:hypothetical protein [Defluviitaleaceae bacterium]
MSWLGRAYSNASYSDDNKQFTTRQLLDLVKNGADFLRDQNLSDVTADDWINYSEKIVELATKGYDTNIYLSYLRMVISIRSSKNFEPYQRIKACLDYLIDVIGVLSV